MRKVMTPFSQYMHNWLYGANGYYASFKAIGKEGDFYTAVSSSRFFGATIAHYMISLIEKGKLSSKLLLLEVGAHQGYLLADMIEWIAQESPELLKELRFGIVERFDSLKTVQKEHFQKRFGKEIELIHYREFSEILEDDIFIVANEIFDSFPCDLVYNGKVAQVILEDSHKIEFTGEDEEVLRIAEKFKQSKGEVAKGYETFASSIFKASKRAVFVSFDYGEKDVRDDFSIRIYKNHNVYPLFDDNIELSKLFGNSDITYDVNFSHVIEAFEISGFDLYSYKTQLKALTEYGIVDLLQMLAEIGDYSLYLRELNKIKTLIEPTIMGERFKLVEFHKNIV